MKRNVYEKLKLWYEQGHVKNLWLYGARKVGKTYLALKFAYEHSAGYYYIDLNKANYRKAVKESPAAELCLAINNILAIPEEYSKKIIYVVDNAEEYSALAEVLAGAFAHENLAAIFIAESDVPFEGLFSLRLFPFSFDEFLLACDKEWYVDVIRGHFLACKKVPGMIHDELLSLFTDYLETGGLPENIEKYINGDIQETLISSLYRGLNCIEFEDRDKAAKYEDKYKLLLNAIPGQLAKKDKRFKFSFERKGLCYADLEAALKMLEGRGYLYKLPRLKISGAVEAGEYETQNSAFILYNYDHGLLAYELSKNIALDDIKFDPIVKLQVEELLIANGIRSGKKLCFWESEANAKVDLIEITEEGLLPFEIKLEQSKRSKSMNTFKKKYGIKKHIRISPENFFDSEDEKIIPVYAIFCL